MRRPFIAGNWKMNLDGAKSRELAQSIAALVGPLAADVDIAICAPYVYLMTVRDQISQGAIALGAQDAYFESEGAFTGEISTGMLADVGCQFVIVGHSERRHVLHESDATINLKVKAVLAAGLTPILCLGELLEQREAGQTLAVVKTQFQGGLAGLSADEVAKIVLAYEPVWAIGTGKVATPEQAEQVHADLRTMLESGYNSATAEAVRIQYGGSVKPGNAADLLCQPNIDGALVGGASLDADSFHAIVKAAAS